VPGLAILPSGLMMIKLKASKAELNKSKQWQSQIWQGHID
jgi:hypothetical protein